MPSLENEVEKFFQTDTSIEKQKQRSEKIKIIEKAFAKPLYIASCQILSTHPLDTNSIFVAESGFIFRLIDLSVFIHIYAFSKLYLCKEWKSFEIF